MKAFLIPALAAAVLAAPLHAAEDSPAAPLTLAAAIDEAVARYPTLAAAQAAIDAARGRAEQSGSERLPQVSLDGDYAYNSLRPYVAFGPTSFYETISDSYAATVSVRQLLTDFGRTDALVARARAGEISARDALEQARRQIGYQAIGDFYGVLLLRQSVGVADEEIRALQEAERAAEKRLSGGSATRLDLLTTDVRLATARNRRADTVAALQKQEAALRALLGLEPAAALPLSGDFGAPAALPAASAAIAEGLQNRPEMKLAQDREKVAELGLDAAERGGRPALSAQAAAGVEDGVLPSMYDNRGYATAGVVVSLPLFTGERLTGQRVEARADLRAARAEAQALNLTVATDVQDALADLGAARARLDNSDLLVAQAREALSLARSRYANGVITDFELLDAQSSARAAELARLQARYDCAVASQALARAEGRPPR